MHVVVLSLNVFLNLPSHRFPFSEEPEEWLHPVESHCHRVSNIVRLHLLLRGQGVGIEFSGSANTSSETLLLVLGDRERSEAFSAQLTQALLEHVSSGSPMQSVDRTADKANKLARHLQDEARVMSPYEKVDHFAAAYFIANGGFNSVLVAFLALTSITPLGRSPCRVSVVLTQSSCVVTSDFFQWDSSANKSTSATSRPTPLGIKRSFMIRDVTQVDLFDLSPRQLRLSLTGEVAGEVTLVFDTEATLLGVMAAIRTVWEKLRKMDIEVSRHCERVEGRHYTRILYAHRAFFRKLSSSICKRRARF